ncbi:MAG: hypothetical protein V5A46_00405 [Haloferacaceae archaeon]
MHADTTAVWSADPEPRRDCLRAATGTPPSPCCGRTSPSSPAAEVSP